MTKYDELTAKSDKYSTAYFASRDRCSGLVRAVAISFQKFLEAPEGRILFVTLDADLKSGKETVPITSLPDLRRGHDGRWYVGLRIDFRKPNPSVFGQLTLKLGLKPIENNLQIHFENEFDINPEDPKTYEPFFLHIYNGLLEDYSKGVDQPTRRIGF
jgi:hypothetical protein